MAKPGPKRGYKHTPEHTAKTVAALTTHGATVGRPNGRKPTREYRAWSSMKFRCRWHRRYRGKGITVCPAWQSSFEAFLRDMGPCPPGMELDRINSDGHYEPENCRWATQKEQAQNTSTTRWITHNGETLCLSDWAQRIGVPVQTLRHRLAREPVAQALTPIPEKRGPKLGFKQSPEHIAGHIRRRWITHNGETLCLADWATRLGINDSSLHRRLTKLPVDQALTRPRFVAKKGRT